MWHPLACLRLCTLFTYRLDVASTSMPLTRHFFTIRLDMASTSMPLSQHFFTFYPDVASTSMPSNRHLSLPISTWHPLACLWLGIYSLVKTRDCTTQALLDYTFPFFWLTFKIMWLRTSWLHQLSHCLILANWYHRRTWRLFYFRQMWHLSLRLTVANHPVQSSERTTPGLILPTGDTWATLSARPHPIHTRLST